MRLNGSAGQKRIFPVLLGFLLLSRLVFAQDFATAKPESVGLSSERLDRISTAVQRDIDDKRIAGVVTLVIRHNKVAWFKAQGNPRTEKALLRRCGARFYRDGLRALLPDDAG
jgi:CubicO group peptidase (beta-lactamase class C family)